MELPPNGSVRGSLTLMRGYEGALFPSPGLYRIDVELRWSLGPVEAVVGGGATLLVTSAQDASHAAVAHQVLATPDAHLVLVLGGDHLQEGMDAIKAAVGNDVLRPHFASIEAKRLAQRTGRRAPDLAGAVALVDEGTVMSGAEVGKLARLVKGAAGKPKADKLVQTLKAKAEQLSMPKAARAAVDAL